MAGRRLATSGRGADARDRTEHGGREDLRKLPGRDQHHVLRVRRRHRRFRVGLPHREPLLREPGRVTGQQEHDRHAVVPAQCDQQGQVASPQGRSRLREVDGQKARHPGRRHDGRRHRLCIGEGRHRMRAARLDDRSRREGQDPFREPARQGHQKRPRDAGRQGRVPRPYQGDDVLHRSRRLRSRDRSGVRGSCDQGRGDEEGRGHHSGNRDVRLEHLDAADHRPRGGQRASRSVHRPALLLAGGQDAAGRDHHRCEDLAGDAREGLRLRAADQEDADRRQRFARLLHVTRVRDLHHGRQGAAARRAASAFDRDGRLAGRHAGRAAGAAR